MSVIIWHSGLKAIDRFIFRARRRTRTPKKQREQAHGKQELNQMQLRADEMEHQAEQNAGKEERHAGD